MEAVNDKPLTPEELRERLRADLARGSRIEVRFSSVPGPGMPYYLEGMGPEAICTLEVSVGRFTIAAHEVREHHAHTYSKKKKQEMLSALEAAKAVFLEALDLKKSQIETFTTEDGEELPVDTEIGTPNKRKKAIHLGALKP